MDPYDDREDYDVISVSSDEGEESDEVRMERAMRYLRQADEDEWGQEPGPEPDLEEGEEEEEWGQELFGELDRVEYDDTPVETIIDQIGLIARHCADTRGERATLVRIADWLGIPHRVSWNKARLCRQIEERLETFKQQIERTPVDCVDEDDIITGDPFNEMSPLEILQYSKTREGKYNCMTKTHIDKIVRSGQPLKDPYHRDLKTLKSRFGDISVFTDYLRRKAY